MREILGKLIEALRDELKNYGEMLVLLDRQQECLNSQAAEEISRSISGVRAQGFAIEKTRERREECFRAVRENLGASDSTCFTELIPHLPPDYQPLLTALLEENNALLFGVRRRARQNQTFLKRSDDLMQQVITSLGQLAPESIFDTTLAA